MILRVVCSCDFFSIFSLKERSLEVIERREIDESAKRERGKENRKGEEWNVKSTVGIK